MSDTREMLKETIRLNGVLIAAKATIEQLNTVVKARDIEIDELTEELQRLKEVDVEIGINAEKQFDENQALKAQINALRDGVSHFNRSRGDMSVLLSAYVETPEQCLADYRNSVIDECIAELDSSEFTAPWKGKLEKMKQGGE